MVSTPLKNSSQSGNLPRFSGWTLKNLWNHHPNPMGFPPFWADYSAPGTTIWGHKNLAPHLSRWIHLQGHGVLSFGRLGQGPVVMRSTKNRGRESETYLHSRIFILYVFILIYKKKNIYIWREMFNSQIKPCKSPPNMMMGVERNK